MNYEQKKNIKKICYSKYTLVFLVILLIYLIQGTYGLYTKTIESKNNKIIAEKELKDLIDRQKTVSDGIANLNTKIGLEEEIRQKFDVVKQNENMLIIVNKTASSSVVNKSQNVGFWSWLEDIFNIK